MATKIVTKQPYQVLAEEASKSNTDTTAHRIPDQTPSQPRAHETLEGDLCSEPISIDDSCPRVRRKSTQDFANLDKLSHIYLEQISKVQAKKTAYNSTWKWSDPNDRRVVGRLTDKLSKSSTKVFDLLGQKELFRIDRAGRSWFSSTYKTWSVVLPSFRSNLVIRKLELTYPSLNGRNSNSASATATAKSSTCGFFRWASFLTSWRPLSAKSQPSPLTITIRNSLNEPRFYLSYQHPEDTPTRFETRNVCQILNADFQKCGLITAGIGPGRTVSGRKVVKLDSFAKLSQMRVDFPERANPADKTAILVAAIMLDYEVWEE